MSVVVCIATPEFIVMAADGAISESRKTGPSVRKIERLSDGSLLGGTGEWSAVQALIASAQAQIGAEEPIENKGRLGDVDCLLACPDLSVARISPVYKLTPCPTPGYHCVGSGTDAALGALFLLLGEDKMKGLTLRRAKRAATLAVEAAIAVDDDCDGQIAIGTIPKTGAGR